ncbi:hypothetical protein HDV05_003355 [Chytridiales sp. JEL 0842]|nr:hypothetical protein HDV05_003355 [Chytridiales sp. JEL 0842]
MRNSQVSLPRSNSEPLISTSPTSESSSPDIRIQLDPPADEIIEQHAPTPPPRLSRQRSQRSRQGSQHEVTIDVTPPPTNNTSPTSSPESSAQDSSPSSLTETSPTAHSGSSPAKSSPSSGQGGYTTSEGTSESLAPKPEAGIERGKSITERGKKVIFRNTLVRKTGKKIRGGVKRSFRAVGSLLQDFGNFVANGRVMELAIGLVIGAAFTTVVQSLVNDVFAPVIGLAVGSQLEQAFVYLKQPNAAKCAENVTLCENIKTVAQAQEATDKEKSTKNSDPEMNKDIKNEKDSNGATTSNEKDLENGTSEATKDDAPNLNPIISIAPMQYNNNGKSNQHLAPSSANNQTRRVSSSYDALVAFSSHTRNRNEDPNPDFRGLVNSNKKYHGGGGGKGYNDPAASNGFRPGTPLRECIRCYKMVPCGATRCAFCTSELDPISPIILSPAVSTREVKKPLNSFKFEVDQPNVTLKL